MYKEPIIGIIGGKGIMGSFFADFFAERGCEILVSDVKTPLTNKMVVKLADIVIVAVPIHLTKKVLREVAPLMRADQILADVTSLKVFPIKEMLKSKAQVIGLHPMFRPPHRGAAQNDKSAMKNQTVVMCPVRCSAKNRQWFKKIFSSGGANVVVMTPGHHDHLMAIIQVLVHFHSFVFGTTLRSLKANLREVLKVMSPVYRIQFDVVCRIFAQNAMLYASIGMLNPETKKITRAFVKATQAMQKILTQKQRGKFLNEFKKTAQFLGPFSKSALNESDQLIASFSKSSKK